MDINLTSKFDIDEKVYFLRSETIDYGFVKDITFRTVVNKRNKIEVDIKYTINTYNIIDSSEHTLKESQIYKTIEDLTNDLIENSTENRRQKRTTYGIRSKN